MSVADLKQASSSSHTYLLVPTLLLFVLLVVAVLRAPSLISSVGIGSAIIVAAPLILATYSLTIVAMAGRAGVDLSIGPLIGFINVGLIQLYGAEVITTPVDFFVYAIVVGILYQLLMGLIIVYVRVQPIIVALSGYLALVGLNLVILPRPGGIAPEWMMPWGLGTSIWSPVLAIVVLATAAWFLLTRTAFFGHLRLMGADERTAYTSGVRINIVRLGAHAIAGVYGGLAALTFTSLISSGDPTQGTTYTLMAVTALVLGGTSLAGGRGSVIGSLLGALNIYLITYVLSTFSFGMVQSFVTDAAYGVVLVVSLLLTLVLPRLPVSVRRISPFAFFVVLGIVAFGVVLYAKDKILAPPVLAETEGLTVLGGDGDSGLTVLGGDSDSGLTVLGGDSDSGLTVLGGESEGAGDSGLTVLGGDESGLVVLGGESDETAGAAESQSTGTPLFVALIIAAAGIYLLYLLYRYVSFSTVVFAGVVILLVLGLSLYDQRGGARGPGDMAAASHGAPAPPVFLLEVAETGGGHGGAAGSALTSPLMGWVLVILGTILVSSLLIVIALPQVQARLGNMPLVFFLGIAVAAVSVIVYVNDGVLAAAGGVDLEVLGVLLAVAALLFIASLRRVQARVRDVSLVLLTILAFAALGATFFAAGPREGVGTPTAAVAAAGPVAAWAPGEVAAVDLPQAFYAGTFWVILVAIALFIVTLPRLRARILTYATFEKGVKAFSYTGGFIVVVSVLGFAAMFIAADVPLWKLFVALVAGVIAARYVWRFLRRYRGMPSPMLGRSESGNGNGAALARGAER